MQPEDLHSHVTDVVNQDIMPQLVSTMNQFATNVEKWPIHRKSAGETKQTYKEITEKYQKCTG